MAELVFEAVQDADGAWQVDGIDLPQPGNWSVEVNATLGNGRLVLEAPFTSAADVAARRYPLVPVRWLMKDQCRSDLRIGSVAAPLLVLHGARDTVVPVEYGQRLFRLAHEPKRLVMYTDGQHEGLDQLGALADVKAFLAEHLD